MRRCHSQHSSNHLLNGAPRHLPFTRPHRVRDNRRMVRRVPPRRWLLPARLQVAPDRPTHRRQGGWVRRHLNAPCLVTQLTPYVSGPTLACVTIGNQQVEVAWRGKFRLEASEVYQGLAWWVAEVVDKHTAQVRLGLAPIRHYLVYLLPSIPRIYLIRDICLLPRPHAISCLLMSLPPEPTSPRRASTRSATQAGRAVGTSGCLAPACAGPSNATGACD